MEYRNSGNASHHDKGMAFGVGSSAGVELGGGSTAGTLTAIGDGTNENLVIEAKGAGNLRVGNSSNSLYIGGSTSALKGIGRGIATLVAANPVLLPASALVYSTITIPGVAVGDSLFIGRSTGMSTALGMAGSWVTGADEGSFAVINNLASTQSISSGATFPYLYVKA